MLCSLSTEQCDAVKNKEHCNHRYSDVSVSLLLSRIVGVSLRDTFSSGFIINKFEVWGIFY